MVPLWSNSKTVDSLRKPQCFCLGVSPTKHKPLPLGSGCLDLLFEVAEDVKVQLAFPDAPHLLVFLLATVFVGDSDNCAKKQYIHRKRGDF